VLSDTTSHTSAAGASSLFDSPKMSAAEFDETVSARGHAQRSQLIAW
jgi:hypothetical protein